MDNAPTSCLARAMQPINGLLAPIVRTGAANPWPLGTGFVLLEVTGRKTGQLRTIPLVCTDYGAFQVVSTVRERSQWLRNLAAVPEAGLWLRGRRRDVIASVYQMGERLDSTTTPTGWQDAAARSLSRITGASIAVLTRR